MHAFHISVFRQGRNDLLQIFRRNTLPVGNLVCAYFAFKAENLKKMFLNLPLITVSWSALIAMMVIGTGLMLIPNCPAWIAAIVCIVILAFNAIAVITAVWAANTVDKVDEKVKIQTSYIRNLRRASVSDIPQRSARFPSSNRIP